MIKKKLSDCKFIFLDSGILIDLLKQDISSSSDEVQQRIILTKKLFASFADKKTLGNTDKIYQLSSISIAVIFHIDNLQDNTLNAIISTLDSGQVEILDFDYST